MKKLLLGLITTYQRHLSPKLGSRCRFYPSCSHYATGCLEKYTVPKAITKISGRLLRCQPWHVGGFDEP